MTSNDNPYDNSKAHILDLTHDKTLFELAIEPYELIGSGGAKLIAELKERAFDAEYTHLYFRDPIRPGMVWFIGLEGQDGLPTRGKLEECRKTTEKVFPGFLKNIENHLTDNEDDASVDAFIHSQIPPISSSVTGMDLATALEYLVFVYPEMVRAWAALIFTYSEMLHLREGAERTKLACVASCQSPEIVSYFLSGFEELPVNNPT